jgi:hypothetical protein
MQLVTTWLASSHGVLDVFVIHLIADGYKIDACVPLKYDVTGKLESAMIVYSYIKR